MFFGNMCKIIKKKSLLAGAMGQTNMVLREHSQVPWTLHGVVRALAGAVDHARDVLMLLLLWQAPIQQLRVNKLSTTK